VTVVLDADSTAASADGMDLVVISSTASATNTNTKFTRVPVGVVTWERYLFRELELTGPAADVQYGVETAQRELVLVDSCHPASAGLAGTATVFTADSDLSWGRPVAAATVIATTEADPGHATLFAVEAGDLLDDASAAPARRMGLFFVDDGPSVATDDAARLALASFCWTAGL
jgi:hypothetical protein